MGSEQGGLKDVGEISNQCVDIYFGDFARSVVGFSELSDDSTNTLNFTFNGFLCSFDELSERN